jgi:Domain of unknown function (DU1801)
VSEAAFRQMLERFPPRIGELALAARGLVFEVIPRVVEVVWPHQGSAGYGTGPKKMSEQFCYLTLYPRFIRFGFYYATELPDPEGLLTDGGGKLMRSMKVTDAAQLRQPALRELLEVSTTHRVPPLPPE